MCAQQRLGSAWASAQSDQSKAWVLSYRLSTQRRLLSDWADAQADLSLRWVHRSFCWFCHEAAHIFSLNSEHVYDLEKLYWAQEQIILIKLSSCWIAFAPSIKTVQTLTDINWAAAWQNQQNELCAQQRLISLDIHSPDQFLLCALWVANDQRFLHADSEDSDQTGRMPRLIGVCCRTHGQFVGFVMLWLHKVQTLILTYMDHVKRICYLSPMRAAKVQASLRIRPVSPEPSLLPHTNSESRGTFRQKARSLASLNGWACAVKTCHDGMLADADTNLLDGDHIY